MWNIISYLLLGASIFYIDEFYKAIILMGVAGIFAIADAISSIDIEIIKTDDQPQK